MKTIKSLLFVIATITAAICEGKIQWRVRVYDELGNTPTFQSVGYFVPTYEGLNGHLVDREVVLEMLRHGDIQSARAYMVGKTYMGSKKVYMSSGQLSDYDPEAGQTVSGFAVVFDSPSIETATKFAATEEQSQSVDYTGATIFSFANSIGIDAWETIGSATSGYEYLGGTWYYSANGDDTLTITGVDPGSSRALTIPGAIDGCPVTVVGDNAFDNCTTITNVVISSSMTSIGDSAFHGCSGLKSVTIPDSVTNIGDHAFSGCSGLTSVTFEGDAPVLGNFVFDGVSADCTVFVSCDSKGWGVDIPGEWNGLPIEYFDGEPEPDPEPEPEVHMVIFDFGEHGKGFVDGELVGGAIVQMVPDGEPVDLPVVVPDEGWLFFDWVGEFYVDEPITCDTGFVAMYMEEPSATVDLNYAIESLYIKQGDLRDGNLEIHVAFNLREGFDWLDVADALQNQCDIRVLSGHSHNDFAWCEDWGESQSLVLDNDSETLIATVALSGIAERKYFKIIVDDMVDGVFSTDIGMLAYRDGEYVFVTGAAMFEGPGPTKIVECEEWFSMSPLTVSTADCVRFHYDLDEINSMLWGYTRRNREYREPFYAVVVNEDLGIEHIAKVNIETLLSDWVSDTIPNAGYFDWDVSASMVVSGGRYMVGFMPESYIDGDHVVDDGVLFEDFEGLLFDVSVIDGNLSPVETHTVTFYVGEYGERIGGGELVQTVADGETAVVPEVRTTEERLFIGWDGDVTAPVTDDIAFTAMYHTAYLWLNFHCGDHGLIGIEGVREYDFSAFPVLYPYSGSLMWARIDENGEYTSDGNRYQFSLLSPPIIDCEGWHCIGWRNTESGEFFPVNNYDEEAGHLYSNAYVSVTLPVDSCVEASPEWVDFEPVYVEVEPPAAAYVVTFDLGGHGARTGGGELVQSVPFGETAVAPLVLADEGWSFTGWDGDVTAAVTGDVVFSAQWERAKINVRINGEGTICDYGDTVTFTAPGPSEKDGMQVLTLGTTFTAPVLTNEFSLVATSDISFEWDVCATNYWLEVAAPEHGSIVGAESGWQPAYSRVILEPVADEGYHFVEWTGDVAGGETDGCILALEMRGPASIGAAFARDGISAGEAANAPGLDWFCDGAAAWFGEWSADAADGEHAARSGAIGDNSSSVLGVRLHGAGMLAFDWRSSCEAKYDSLRLEVDGKLLRNISGETVWKNVTVELGGGDHVVRWVYAKGRSRSEGQDAVWLDNVSWAPAGVPTLAEALGDFEWVTDGDVSWTAIRNEYAYEGDSFAYADGLGDYEYASLRTTVSGAGRLVFRWAVSCEYWCDWFDFMVDGEVMEMLTGETDWLEVSVDLADGPHEFEWVYWKDEMDDGEFAWANCAMLDYVQWFPAGEVPPEISEETVSEFFAWLKEHRRLEETDTTGDAAALVADKTPVSAKGMTLYQEFVAGTNPDDENDVFTAEIKVSADGVSVTPHPNLGDKRVYTLLGRKTLGGSADDWVEVRAGEEANYNFFKVTVDIK